MNYALDDPGENHGDRLHKAEDRGQLLQHSIAHYAGDYEDTESVKDRYEVWRQGLETENNARWKASGDEDKGQGAGVREDHGNSNMETLSESD